MSFLYRSPDHGDVTLTDFDNDEIFTITVVPKDPKTSGPDGSKNTSTFLPEFPCSVPEDAETIEIVPETPRDSIDSADFISSSDEHQTFPFKDDEKIGSRIHKSARRKTSWFNIELCSVTNNTNNSDADFDIITVSSYENLEQRENPLQKFWKYMKQHLTNKSKVGNDIALAVISKEKIQFPNSDAVGDTLIPGNHGIFPTGESNVNPGVPESPPTFKGTINDTGLDDFSQSDDDDMSNGAVNDAHSLENVTSNTPSATGRLLTRLWSCVKAQTLKLTCTYGANWTLLQAWNFVAYVSCVVPHRLVLCNQTGKYILQSWLPQQILWLVRLVPLFLLTIGVFPNVLESFSHEVTPLTILFTADTILSACTRICFIYNVLSGSTSLCSVEDTYCCLEKKYERSIASPSSKTIAVSSVVGFTFYVCIMVVLYIFSATFAYHQDWGGEPAIVLQAFALHGKRFLFWQNNKDSDIATDVAEMSTHEIIWGLVGLLIFGCDVVNYQNIILQLFSSCLSLLFAINFISAQSIPLKEKFDSIIQVKDKTSALIGGLLLCFMTDLSLSIPNLIIKMYQNDSTYKILFHALNLLVVLTPLIIGSIAAMKIDKLKNEITAEDNLSELPSEHDGRDVFLYKLMTTSTGIGYNGVFALNFATLLGYGVGVAGVILVIAEAISSLHA